MVWIETRLGFIHYMFAHPSHTHMHIHPPGELYFSQIIKVLGTPSRDEIRAMNSNYTEVHADLHICMHALLVMWEILNVNPFPTCV
jgi:hypothetical protein